MLYPLSYGRTASAIVPDAGARPLRCPARRMRLCCRRASGSWKLSRASRRCDVPPLADP